MKTTMIAEARERTAEAGIVARLDSDGGSIILTRTKSLRAEGWTAV